MTDSFKEVLAVGLRFHEPPRSALVLADADGKMLIDFRANGEVRFGESYSKEAAARVFWEALPVLNPLHSEVARLRDLIQSKEWAGHGGGCIHCFSSHRDLGHKENCSAFTPAGVLK